MSKPNEKHDDGGLAFPVPCEDNYETGMSLEDWFAGMALQGILAKMGSPTSAEERSSAACDAYDIAVEMIKVKRRIP